jgi:hypothetical protein
MKEHLITVRLTADQAMALAQFVKRVTWQGVRDCAVDKDETQDMLDALGRIQTELAEKGCAPR